MSVSATLADHQQDDHNRIVRHSVDCGRYRVAGHSISKQDQSAIEWQSLALILFIYAAWLAITYWSSALPWWCVAPIGAILITWHSSFQHEVLHGHPTKWRAVNRAFGVPPLSLWLPYEIYRRSHLVHHRDERLTDPLDDPESYYWTEEHWQSLGMFGRALVRIQTTLLGRILVGPAWNIGRFLKNEWGALLNGDHRHAGIWARHALGVALVMIWITQICGMSWAFYLFAIVYPGTSILLIRSFAEHRATDGVFERTAIVENAPILGVLFLYNNLHAAHHAEPMMPWYKIPAWYRQNRERLIRDNGGLVYNGYLDVARRFLLKGYDRPEHPTGRAPYANGLMPKG